MPAYTFVCKECGNRRTEIARMSEVSELEPLCLICDRLMQRDYKADLFATANDSYRVPLHSDALAVAPSQRKEHETKFPYIKLDKKCRPILDNFKDHDRYLKESGCVKKPGKSRRRSTKVS